MSTINTITLILVLFIMYGFWIVIIKPMIEQAIDTHKKTTQFRNKYERKIK